MLESCQETSKLSVDSFMDPIRPHSSSEMRFLEKNRRKSLNHMSYPPWLVKRVISRHRVSRGGLHLIV